MFKDNYENAELYMEALIEAGVHHWDGYSEAMEIYNRLKEEAIEDENARIEKINDILMAADTLKKRTALLIGIPSIIADESLFIAKMLNLLDDKAINNLHKDLCSGTKQND